MRPANGYAESAAPAVAEVLFFPGLGPLPLALKLLVFPWSHLRPKGRLSDTAQAVLRLGPNPRTEFVQLKTANVDDIGRLVVLPLPNPAPWPLLVPVETGRPVGPPPCLQESATVVGHT